MATITGSISPHSNIAGGVSPRSSITGDISTSGNLIGTISSIFSLVGGISARSTLVGTLNVPRVIADEPYEGSYEFTPSAETQTIEIANKTAIADIIINPIPENYGLITWDGSTLTVS